jgi:hypothetical protein
MHDELLRGLTHTLSNRVGTIAAVSSLLDLGGASSARALETLRTETERLEQVLTLLRQLPYRAAQEAEPLLAADVVQGAVALVAHHPAAREVACEVVSDGEVLPAWSDPNALQLAIAVALISAQANASSDADRVQVRLRSHDDVVRFDVTGLQSDPRAGDERMRDAGAASWLLRATDGRAAATEHGLALEVLSLAAARRKR